MSNLQEPDLRYVLKNNNQYISEKYISKMEALSALNRLPQDTQQLTEIVAVDKDGREILFG